MISTIEDLWNINLGDNFINPDDAEEFAADDDVDDIQSLSSFFSLVDQLDHKKVRYEYGASKLVLFFEDREDIVVKIPFRCDIDYCAKEAEVYEEAKKAGIGYLFAGTYYSGHTTADGTEIYYSERVTCYGEGNPVETITPSKKSFELSYSLDVDYLFPQYWLAQAIESYGKKAVEKMMILINKLEINDFHNDNIGYTFIYRDPVLLDYSGYNG